MKEIPESNLISTVFCDLKSPAEKFASVIKILSPSVLTIPSKLNFIFLSSGVCESTPAVFLKKFQNPVISLPFMFSN